MDNIVHVHDNEIIDVHNVHVHVYVHYGIL